jgi:uncharacterized protein
VSFLSKLARLETSAPPPDKREDVLAGLRARIEATLARTACRAHALPGVDHAEAEPRMCRPPPVDTVELPFATQMTSSGPLHVRMQRLSAAHRTGRAPVAGAREVDMELLALLALDPTLAACDASRALFLDTETTGLSGGAGTVAFLVGLAWWDGQALMLEQLVVRALGEEAPMLERVRDRVAAASMLVTFNGKSFDLPLLRTRFVMARVAPPAEPPHLDLLHVARRVHGKRIKQGCRLVVLEREVLGFVRSDDVESADVSACYLHFLRTGDARALLGVVEHNAWDVVAMASLLGRYGEPLNHDFVADDLAGMARTFHRAGAIERASSAAEAAVEREATPRSLRARADIAKARGDRAGALADFEALVARADDPSARLELAKLYEHWARAPSVALTWAEQGTGEGTEATHKRRDRLAAKIERARRKTR